MKGEEIELSRLLARLLDEIMSLAPMTVLSMTVWMKGKYPYLWHYFHQSEFIKDWRSDHDQELVDRQKNKSAMRCSFFSNYRQSFEVLTDASGHPPTERNRNMPGQWSWSCSRSHLKDVFWLLNKHSSKCFIWVRLPPVFLSRRRGEGFTVEAA